MMVEERDGGGPKAQEKRQKEKKRASARGRKHTHTLVFNSIEYAWRNNFFCSVLHFVEINT